jgi:hypothetical protein
MSDVDKQQETTKKPGGRSGKGFVKGDPRINRKGRPKDFNSLRELAQGIAHEAAKQGNQPVVIDGHVVTVTEAIMRSWAISKDPRLQQKFIEVAYGQVPSVTRLEGTDGGPIQVTITRKAEGGNSATPDN